MAMKFLSFLWIYDLIKRSPCKRRSVKSHTPLASRARPEHISGFKGHGYLFERYPFLKGNLPSVVLWGPPGNGKTTLAKLLVQEEKGELHPFNAVLGGVGELRKVIQIALGRESGKKQVIFIDEIHRFNKAQQDALLPYVEAGDFTLIGATTENPRVALNGSLLSRLQIVELMALEASCIEEILHNACEKFFLKAEKNTLSLIASYCGGDARKALNILESIQGTSLSPAEVKKLIADNARAFDRNQDRHYDVISAFIKSMRGSDPHAACLWLAVMIDGGEDPVFIARRLVVFASEDVGNADPTALILARSVLSGVMRIGMPEGRILLAQATTYLASTVKSNRSYQAIDEALKYVKERATLEVPSHLKNNPLFREKYRYPHDYPDGFVRQSYTEEEIPSFYRPVDRGREKWLKERLESLQRHQGE